MKHTQNVKSLTGPLCAILLSLALLLSLSGCGYKAVHVSAALQSDGTVRVRTIRNGTFFDGPGETDALVLYPGAQVEETAYAPLLHKLAAEGVDCFAVKMPLGYAFLGVNLAEKLMKSYNYTRWCLAGHSLGGAMAARFAAKHGETLSGLILLGAYSADDLSEAAFPVLYIYGSNDEVLTRKFLERGLRMSAPDTRIVELAGGNHAFFGSYGEQKGDGKAALSQDQQAEQTVREILKLIGR